ncbi:hypothetical protein FVEN_g6952 [Fusarium venenatum]|uniref:F-box domain-containing protein n=1 Tax=Fusarium venenatum TaxID=56646 RepID=A0A2L2TUP5_9HYPO|nr:uncharacterized protein FVRRES_09504 [Fusarium venenatum]KAG8355040.1 hypothetical protein FVEN_g6952 [Fusarium venenatum]CEI69427.1 unnamed protein product [Fusarium venenatum]
MANPDTAMAGISTPAATIIACPLQKVPLEVLLRITSFLTTPELGNTRLTCRSVEQALFTTFTNEFFTRKQFMISETSLQALIDISKSRLSGYLRMVHIGLDRFAYALQVSDQNARNIRQKQLHDGQFSMLSTGYHRDMLAEAFRNLSNLEDVVIRDFNSNRRSRDNPGKQWTSYGSTTAFRETGHRPGQGGGQAWGPYPSTAYGSSVFISVLFALGQANAKPKGIEYMSRARNHLRDCAFNIPSYMEPSVIPVLENLEKLHIDIDLLGGNDFPVDTSGHPSDMMLRGFLLKLKNIKHLRINETHSSVNGPDMLLKWLGSEVSTSAPASLSAPPSASGPGPAPASISPTSAPLSSIPSPEYPQLAALDFGMMNVEAQHILAVTRKFSSTLKRLELHKITLRRRLPEGHTGASPKVNMWNKFLEKLKDIPNLDLHHIKVSLPQQHWTSRSRCFVAFEDTRDNVSQYTGPDWKHFVEHEMRTKVTVQWSHEDSGDSDDDEEEEDESDGIWDQYALDL